MFVLVSYSNDPYVQDICYHGKFDTMKDVCDVLNDWLRYDFDKDITIDSDELVPGCDIEDTYRDSFFVDITYANTDNDTDYIRGVMGWWEDTQCTFCIAKV